MSTIDTPSPKATPRKTPTKSPKSKPTTTERKKVAGLIKMSDILFERYEKIHQLQCTHNKHESKIKYAIGEHVAEVLKNENAYGCGAAEQLADALGYHHTTLRRYADVTTTWDPAAFKALMKRKGRTGLSPSFSHLIAISRATDPTEREEWIELVLKYVLPVRDLARRMKKNANAGSAVTETPTESEGDRNEDQAADATGVDNDEAADTADSGTSKTADTSEVRRSLARLMSVDVQSIPGQDKAWDEYVFKPLEAEPGQIGGGIEDDLRQTSASLAETIKSLQAYKSRIDGLLKPAMEGGEQNG